VDSERDRLFGRVVAVGRLGERGDLGGDDDHVNDCVDGDNKGGEARGAEYLEELDRNVWGPKLKVERYRLGSP
jgi:hypothetical protein